MKWWLAGFFILVGFFTCSSYAHAVLYDASKIMGQYYESGNYDWTGNVANNSDPDPTAKTLRNPWGPVALDGVHHRLFVPDNNHRVLIFQLDSNNSPSSPTAAYVLGQPDFNSRAYATTQSGMKYPQGVAYDSVNDRLFVNDWGNHRILVFDVASGTLANGKNASYVIGQSDFVTGTSGKTQSKMKNPGAPVYDEENARLFVSDAGNNRVLVFNASTSVLANGMNASYVLGQPDYVTGTATTSQKGFSSPYGLSYDAANKRLFVAEEGNHRVLVFNVDPATIANNENADYVLGQANFTSKVATTTQSGMNTPSGGGYDSVNNRLFVSEESNNRVLIFDVSTSTMANGKNASYVLGQADFVSVVVTTTQNSLVRVSPNAYDSDTGKLFVPDVENSRIMIFDAGTSTISNGANATNQLGHYDESGNGSWTNGHINNSISPATTNAYGFSNPLSATLDKNNHRLFVADQDNFRVLVYQLDNTNNLVSNIPSYVLGQPDFTTNTIGGSTQHTFGGFDGPGNFVFNLVYDHAHDRLFVSDKATRRVLVFNVSPGTIANDMNASYVIGQSNFTTNASVCSRAGVYLSVDNMAYDTNYDRLFVNQQGGNRVMVYDVAPGTIANGMNASYVLGQEDFTTCASGLAADKLYHPTGAMYDSANNRLFINDLLNNRLLVYDVAPGTIANGMNASYVLGQEDFTTNGPRLTRDGMRYGDDMQGYDTGTGRLWTSNRDNPATGNNRIVVFNVSTSTIANGMDAEAMLGASDYTSVLGSGARQDSMSFPCGTGTYDQENRRLFVADGTYHRILQFDFIKITASTLARGTVGQPYLEAVTTTNSQGTVSFSISDGSLPEGLSLNATTGAISGTPTTAGSYAFTVEANDTFDTGPFIDRASFAITVAQGESDSIPVTSVVLPRGPFPSPSPTSSTAPRISPAPAPVFTQPVSAGSHHPSIRALQLFLNAQGFALASTGPGSPGNETDYFGSRTLQALVKFQQAHNLSAESGTLGPRTLALLNAAPAPSAAPVPVSSFSTTLTRGMQSAEVSRLQQFLATFPDIYPSGLVTGYFGPLTQKALQAFQLAYHIVSSPQDPGYGIFGPKTRAKVGEMMQ